MKKITITLRLNGELREVDVEGSDLLLDVLRDKLGAKGPKYGCGSGDCGTCTVLVEGQSVRACIVLAAEVDGQEVVTVEGLAREGIPALQASFVARSAFQCGYCAPGVMITATELLRRTPNPCREEVQEAIAGNLCRCTGYDPIIEAIMAVARPNEEV